MNGVIADLIVGFGEECGREWFDLQAAHLAQHCGD